MPRARLGRSVSGESMPRSRAARNNRDALFIGFVGNLVVGVWVGHDDDRTLGKITGGTAPADIWRCFMGSAISIDGRQGPPLPAGFRVPQRKQERKSPLPDEWSEGGEAVRSILEMVERLIDEN